MVIWILSNKEANMFTAYVKYGCLGWSSANSDHVGKGKDVQHEMCPQLLDTKNLKLFKNDD